MDQSQKDLRRAAAQAFMQSLDQLEETLQPVDTTPDPSPDATAGKAPDSGATRLSTSAPAPSRPTALPRRTLTLDAPAIPSTAVSSPPTAAARSANSDIEPPFDASFEAAVADIEQFFNQ
jgi:hypothetical protein